MVSEVETEAEAKPKAVKKKTGTKVSTSKKTSTVSAKSDETTSSTESSSTETLEINKPPLEPVKLTEEQIAAQKAALEEAIALGVEMFEFGQDEESYKGMTEKEQTFTRLLDPMIWIMREALISYEEREGGCEECTVRVESGNNGLAVATAELMLGRM
jgi:hypothetical protein